MNKKKQLITIDEAVEAKGQHKKPCSDCPWSRESLPGWLGGESVDAWLKEAHGNMDIPCHTLKGAQCAGAAIYRTNVLKRHVAEGVLLLPADRERVFATPMEFKAHHEKGPKGSAPSPEGVQGTPQSEVSVMPKADVIAKNMALSNLKAKHDEKLAKIAAGHAKALTKKDDAAKKAEAKVKADFAKVAAWNKMVAFLVSQTNVDPKKIPKDTDKLIALVKKNHEQRQAKIAALLAKIRSVTEKYTGTPPSDPANG